MDNSSKILCYRHSDECSSTIFCRGIQEICKNCLKNLTNFIIPPFELPIPFTNKIDSNNYKPCLIIRPSNGTFFDYKCNDDLHIGLINSNKQLYEYDQRGLVTNDFENWKSFIIFDNFHESWYSHFDDILTNKMLNNKLTKWNKKNYNPVYFNCFNFIIEFLNELKYPDYLYNSKKEICEKLILPKIHETLRFIKINNHLKNNDFYIVNN